MNHLFWTALVLAEGGRAGQFVKGFRAGNLDRVSVSSLLLIAVGGLLIALILYAWERFARSDERRSIFSERRLFQDLCRLHRLDRAAIRCLEDLIRSAKLVHAAEVFVRPDLFQTKGTNALDRSLRQQLRSKLFSA
jgi:hypothetical protein